MRKCSQTHLRFAAASRKNPRRDAQCWGTAAVGAHHHRSARHAPSRYLAPIQHLSDTVRLLHCITVDILIAERGDYKWFDNIGECPSRRTWQLGDTVGRNDVFSRVRVVTEQHLVLRLSLW